MEGVFQSLGDQPRNPVVDLTPESDYNLNSLFTVSLLIKHECQERKGNDRQLKKFSTIIDKLLSLP